MALSRDKGSYLSLLRYGNFRRFFVAQSLSSFGDWIGMIAILALVARITHNEFAVAAMLLARLAPALLFGPIAGVFVDRWNRKRVMVFCDVVRAGLIASLPFVETIRRVFPPAQPVVVLFIVSAMLETMTILWQSSKDANLPSMVTKGQLTHANSLMLLAAYGTFPLSGAAFGLLVPLSRFLGQSFPVLVQFELNEELLAFAFDSFTFLISAAVTATLAIPALARTKRPAKLSVVWHEFTQGLRIIRGDPRIRPWLLGIGLIFSGVGTFLAIAVFYITEILGAGSEGFGLMVTAVGVGLGSGFLAAGIVGRITPRDVLFTASVLGLGASLFGFASVSTLATGLALGAILGFFAGLSYPSGLTLMQENASESMRGRILSSMHSVVRLALVGGLALAPSLAKVVGDTRMELLGQEFDFRGARVVLWLGGLTIFGAGLITMQAVVARWKGARPPGLGLFLAFEGGEGVGKSTQIERLRARLEASGRKVTVTREPGGTKMGERIREVLLDPDSDDISGKTEALLYAADRAQNVEEVILPALKRGEVVISDRYIDSSLAYQGFARGLGIDDVLDLNRWATGNLLPDLVLLLDVDPETGLLRSGTSDRMEKEAIYFHQAVRDAFRLLVARYPRRFFVIDAEGDPDLIAEEIARRVEDLLESKESADGDSLADVRPELESG